MEVVLVFVIALLLATLISELAQRSVISTAVLFLIAGFVTGDGMLGILSLRPANPLVLRVAPALFTVLFFGEVIAELFKLAAFLAFGALISPHFLGTVGIGSYAFALLALIVARPVAVEISLLRVNSTGRNGQSRHGSVRKDLPRSFTAFWYSTADYRMHRASSI